MSIVSARKLKMPSPVSGVPNQDRPGKSCSTDTAAFHPMNANKTRMCRRPTNGATECPVRSRSIKLTPDAAPTASNPTVVGSVWNQTPYANGGVASMKTKTDNTTTAVPRARAQTAGSRLGSNRGDVAA